MCITEIVLMSFLLVTSNNHSNSLRVQIATMLKMPVLSDKKQVQNVLLLSLIMTLANLFFLEPRTTETLMKRIELEDMPGGKSSTKYNEATDSFLRYHALSSIANLICLCGAVIHSMHLATSFV